MNRTRTIIASASVLALALIGVAWWQLSSVDERVRVALEERLAGRLQVPVSVSGVRLSLLDQNLVIEGLEIGNPSGFRAEHFLTAGLIEVDFSLSSLFGSTLQVHQILVDDVEVQLENRRGRFNYQQIVRNLEEGSALQGDSGSGRMLRVSQARVRSIRATVSVTERGFRLPSLKVVIPEVRLEDFGTEQRPQLPLDQVARHFIGAISRNLLEQAAGSSGSGWQRLLQGFILPPQASPEPEEREKARDQLKNLFKKRDPQ